MYQQGGQKERMDKSWSAAGGWNAGLRGGVTGEWPQEDQHGSDATSPQSTSPWLCFRGGD